MADAPLVIRLTGTIEQSNFDDYKRDLLARIESIETDLYTDDDFATAADQVKALKAAELTLRDAKASALEQAESVQELFAAIDEVSEQARQTRLSLERQIKARKAEIKGDFIDAGLHRVREAIERQSPDFALIDTSEFLDRAQFEEATKGKSGIRGLESAIDELCRDVERAIDDRAVRVRAAVRTIEGVPEAYRPLFQDRAGLLGLSQRELEDTIEKRIAVFEAQRAGAEAARDTALPADEVVAPWETAEPAAAPAASQHFQLVVRIVGSRETASRIEQAVRERLAGDDAVREIRLVGDETSERG
jgi:hypothetical protein